MSALINLSVFTTAGEPGLFLSSVPPAMMKDGNLKVYRSSDEANEKKLVRNAFAPGDLYFNYGDVFVLDSDYFLYFQDRIGDTFRSVSICMASF